MKKILLLIAFIIVAGGSFCLFFLTEARQYSKQQSLEPKIDGENNILKDSFTVASIIEINPKLGELLDLSVEGEKEFAKHQQKCEELWSKMNKMKVIDITKLPKEEQILYENCDETIESYWDVMGGGCSWYCAGGQDTLSASSCLASNKEITYEAANIHDLNYKTAWVEGVDGYGIGESVTYHFPPQNPRMTEIIIANGYIKSEKAWKENSRVKKLKMYLNDIPFAILNLSDSRHKQHFEVEPLGYTDEDKERKMTWWTIKFEILDVYKGEKYDDTAISEIYFDGNDSH